MFGFDLQALTAAWTPLLGMDEGPMKVVAEGQQGSFQPFIFWAYGLACLLLLLFTAWTVTQVRGLDQRIHHRNPFTLGVDDHWIEIDFVNGILVIGGEP